MFRDISIQFLLAERFIMNILLDYERIREQIYNIYQITPARKKFWEAFIQNCTDEGNQRRLELLDMLKTMDGKNVGHILDVGIRFTEFPQFRRKIAELLSEASTSLGFSQNVTTRLELKEQLEKILKETEEREEPVPPELSPVKPQLPENDDEEKPSRNVVNPPSEPAQDESPSREDEMTQTPDAANEEDNVPLNGSKDEKEAHDETERSSITPEVHTHNEPPSISPKSSASAKPQASMPPKKPTAPPVEPQPSAPPQEQDAPKTGPSIEFRPPVQSSKKEDGTRKKGQEQPILWVVIACVVIVLLFGAGSVIFKYVKKLTSDTTTTTTTTTMPQAPTPSVRLDDIYHIGYDKTKNRGFTFDEAQREAREWNEKHPGEEWGLPTREQMNAIRKASGLNIQFNSDYPYWTADEAGGDAVYCVCLATSGTCQDDDFPKKHTRPLLLIRKK